MPDENTGFFDPSDADLDKFMELYGNEDGTMDEDKFAEFMSGDLDLSAASDSDTLTGDKPEEEASQASEPQEEKADADDSTGAEAEDQEAAGDATDEEPETKEDPVVQAKDGENVIPFHVLDDLRKEVSNLKEQNVELKTLLEDEPEAEERIAEAQKKDLETGNTEATAELFADLEEDFPGIGEKLHKTLVEPMQRALEKLDAIDQLVEDKAARDADIAKQDAQEAFEADIAKIDSRYSDTVKNDDFWTWFDGQPKFYQASLKSGDPEHFAAIVTEWNDKVVPAAAKEPEPERKPEVKAQPTKEEVAEKAASIKDEAEKKPGVETLSDLPGAVTNPDEDEAHSMTSISNQDLTTRFLDMDPTEIEGKLSKVL